MLGRIVFSVQMFPGLAMGRLLHEPHKKGQIAASWVSSHKGIFNLYKLIKPRAVPRFSNFKSQQKINERKIQAQDQL